MVSKVHSQFFKSNSPSIIIVIEFYVLLLINLFQVATPLFKWIETWYNRKRRHSALGYKTIEEFEILNNNQKLAA
ncbi:MAG: hypothetical protein GQ525_13415 [Draconibacterium sp.]|nr:hypothetical protein [Draconibacterium sp.]